MRAQPVKWVCGFALSLAALCQSAAARPLNEVELFTRCHAHLTQSRVAANDPLLAQVRSGSKTALVACTELLDMARFSGSTGTIADPGNVQAKNVLQTMHQLHRSWSREKDITRPNGDDTYGGTETWFEDAPMGGYITRALFDSRFDVRSITTGTDYVMPVRPSAHPTRVSQGIPDANREWRLDQQGSALHPFANMGELLGVRAVSLPPIQWTRFGPLNSIPDFPNLVPVPGLVPTATSTLPNINLIDASAVRGPLTETVQFGIWVNGQIDIPVTGVYTFYLEVFDQARFFLNGVQRIDRNNGEGVSAALTLNAGRYPIQIRYRKAGNPNISRLILSWSRTAGGGFPELVREVIPATALVGPAGEPDLSVQYYLHGNPQTVQLTGSFGGGFIGNHNYLLTTFQEGDMNYVPNGQEVTNRSWARAVLADTLCRDIPVVREGDVTDFVVPTSTVPFRQQSGCTTCHATVDRQAGLIRNLRWNVLQSVGNEPPVRDWIGITGLRLTTPDRGESTAWPASLDTDYARRPSYGHLYFRNHRGNLIDVPVRSFEELAAAIRAQEDHYICFAKRYYQYFTGIEVPLGDPGDPSYIQPNAVDAWHLARVKELGLSLQQHGSLRQLVLDILASPQYRLSDYGISFSG